MASTRLDWDDLRILLAVARAGTLSAAAPALGLTQPTAGRRLRALEGRCGCALFQRNAHGMVPTAEGRALLAHAEAMEQEALAAERALTGAAPGLEGLLRLSASDWVARLVIAPLLVPFLARHPAVTVELLTETRLSDLARQEADLVFRFPRFESAETIQRHFIHAPYALYASPDDPEPLAGTPRLILMDSALDRLPDALWLRRRFPTAAIALRSNSREVQAEACRARLGLAVLPKLVGERYGLQPVALDEAPPGRDIWLGYHSDLKPLARLRALVEHLTAPL